MIDGRDERVHVAWVARGGEWRGSTPARRLTEARQREAGERGLRRLAEDEPDAGRARREPAPRRRLGGDERGVREGDGPDA